nr:immunoglobulin light chain junction region [Macaca mulatta]MOV72292.1 immunoglobulin light chain junction region [Macaca mulatta]MOV72351.1 immunoglobulin light chain junction region [Macaca mulatta]MOV72407.1 immunoglobulin light chain junction region [Macaca mulatta]MOV72734.1 immunoglobulin light chain junction region [Macaca mulatta]
DYHCFSTDSSGNHRGLF